MSASSRGTNAKPFRVLGVCGGIGSGKSTACKLLVSEFNCLAHLDADSIGHSVYSPGSETVRLIGEEFGQDVLQNDPQEVNRPKLGAIVFSDPDQMKKLERLVWPQIKLKIQSQIQELQAKQRGIVILEAAVLLDADWEDVVDGVWVIRTSQDTALQRLQDTRGLSQEEALKRIAAQESRRGIGNLEDEVRNGVVTGVIDNDGTLDDLKSALAKMLQDDAAWNTK